MYTSGLSFVYPFVLCLIYNSVCFDLSVIFLVPATVSKTAGILFCPDIHVLPPMLVDKFFPYFFLYKRMNFSIKDLFIKYDQIYSFLMIWSHLLKKSLKEKLIFNAVYVG